MSLLPENDKQRKMLPMFKQIARYFPKALREITKVSVVNNVRYNPDRAPADINWARGKSTDQLGSAFHHMLEHAVDGKVFEEVPKAAADATGFDKVYILAEAAWRVLAELELTIEEQEAKVPAEQVARFGTLRAEHVQHCWCACGLQMFIYPEGGSPEPVVRNGVTHTREGCTGGDKTAAKSVIKGFCEYKRHENGLLLCNGENCPGHGAMTGVCKGSSGLARKDGYV